MAATTIILNNTTFYARVWYFFDFIPWK